MEFLFQRGEGVALSLRLRRRLRLWARAGGLVEPLVRGLVDPLLFHPCRLRRRLPTQTR